MFLAVASAVAVADNPLQEPEEPETLPVTFPVNAPVKSVEVIALKPVPTPPVILAVPSDKVSPVIDPVRVILASATKPEKKSDILL